ncbi:MAG: cytochrome c [Verrucomicrobiota bacterium]
MSDSSDPNSVRRDYEENLSVVDEHAVAAAREKPEPRNGSEPISLWAFLLAAIILLLGGSYLGATNGGMLKMDQYTLANYVPQKPETGGGVEAPKDWIDVHMKGGKKVYSNVCVGCHTSSGVGGGEIPPLAESDWVYGSWERLASIVLNGLKGPVEVNGKMYNAAGMQAWKAALNDEQMAQVLTYIRRSFGNLEMLPEGDDGVVTAGMTKTARDKWGEKEDNHIVSDFAGMTFEIPTEKVDLVTGEPIDG